MPLEESAINGEQVKRAQKMAEKCLSEAKRNRSRIEALSRRADALKFVLVELKETRR